jgi:hypothetical protein
MRVRMANCAVLVQTLLPETEVHPAGKRGVEGIG